MKFVFPKLSVVRAVCSTSGQVLAAVQMDLEVSTMPASKYGGVAKIKKRSASEGLSRFEKGALKPEQNTRGITIAFLMHRRKVTFTTLIYAVAARKFLSFCPYQHLDARQAQKSSTSSEHRTEAGVKSRSILLLDRQPPTTSLQS